MLDFVVGFYHNKIGQGISTLIDIRHATSADVTWILGQLRSFSKFYGTNLELFGDETHAKDFIEGIVEDHVMFIADHPDSGSIGLIGGVLTRHMFNPKIILLSELFWWVDEAYRGTNRAGLKLLNEFTKWGKANADWVTMGIEAQSPINEKCLIKRGYKFQEKNFLLEVEG